MAMPHFVREWENLMETARELQTPQSHSETEELARVRTKLVCLSVSHGLWPSHKHSHEQTS